MNIALPAEPNCLVIPSRASAIVERNHLTIWCARPSEIVDETLIQHYASLLTPEEHVRHQRFRFPKDRHRFLITRALVRTTLSRYADIAPADWLFADNGHGRPAIDARHACARCLTFNVSHSGDWVILATGHEVEVGIDVEDLGRGAPIELVDRYFSENEAADLRGLPLAEQPLRFFELWTLKESYTKARGRGLSLALNSFAFDFSLPGSVAWTCGPPCEPEVNAWRLLIARPDGDHLASLCFRARDGRHVDVIWRNVIPLQAESHFEPAILRQAPPISAAK